MEISHDPEQTGPDLDTARRTDHSLQFGTRPATHLDTSDRQRASHTVGPISRPAPAQSAGRGRDSCARRPAMNLDLSRLAASLLCHPERMQEGARPDTPELCLVCGLRVERAGAELPWGDSGTTPTHTFCDCCGVEFGYGDASIHGIRKWRRQWTANGMDWEQPDRRPTDWAPETQLGQLPARVR